MGYGWIAGLFLLLQQNHLPDDLCIDRNGQCIMNVNRTAYSIPLIDTPLIDNKKLEKLINEVEKKIYRAPINAAVHDNGTIMKETPGAKLNREAFMREFYHSFYSQGPSKLKTPVITIYPKVDSELLANIRTQQIGYYVTYFNSSNKNRFHNIVLATKAINNYVVLPGETFSFNRIVGVRTTAKGYMRAKVIVRGEFSEGIGGGICQISSTLFNAVDNAGLQIVERYSHSRSVPYVPPGRDATVNWGGPDFSFKNNYNQPVLISAQALPGRVFIIISSSDVVNFKPRHVPSASDELPEEIHAGTDVGKTVP